MSSIGLRGSVVRDPEHRERQRRQILVAASRVFSQKGYDAATMNDIAAEMGVSKGVLYYQFKSKQDVIVETRRATSGRAADRLQEIVDRHEPVRARMEAALRDLIGTTFDEMGRHVILNPVGTALDAERAVQVRRFEQRYERLVRELLAEGIASGEFVDAPTTLTSLTLIQAALSPAVWFRPGGGLTETDVIDGLTAQLLRSVTTTSS